MKPLILASASPRRREILSLLELPFEVMPASYEAPIDLQLPLSEAVMKVARGKAEEISALYPDRFVLGADTIVVIDGTVLGKPENKEEAKRMLRQLQGREHEVFTGVWFSGPMVFGGGQGFVDSARVVFYPMSDEDIRDYVSTGEPMDKAGAYGIQGLGLRNIRGIHGDFFTVMGLPGARLWHFLKQNHLITKSDS